MAKNGTLELSLTSNYVSDWGVWEGVRELIQNARDGEAEFAAPMTVNLKGQDLHIVNEGVSLPREALLIGHTSKTAEKEGIKWQQEFSFT